MIFGFHKDPAKNGLVLGMYAEKGKKHIVTPSVAGLKLYDLSKQPKRGSMFYFLHVEDLEILEALRFLQEIEEPYREKMGEDFGQLWFFVKLEKLPQAVKMGLISKGFAKIQERAFYQAFTHEVKEREE
jgi:hypothetical protein